MSEHPMDRPLPPGDPFQVALRLFLEPRANPADDPRPSANGELDEAAVLRAATLLRSIVG